ncbi:S-adenosylmethionine decarboxylase proenzyme 4-like [Impatiens glandulifera]|uniref:S-adenosylmethionine decarboxylase proenzyme 4-like n=1 Tax=Impatiens glandulifera TaxID=253017 RepID=UPI001FB09B44|nr:S-adenosylmethionine decarboxylase proenzyme 4-like [Impatiens glandulifera]
MAGFEGFEKRIELQFSGDDPTSVGGDGLGLRGLRFELIEEVLHAVQCTVVSAMGNEYFDSYVLSESSLFVYPTKIIIKTCGTTQLLKSIRPLIVFARDLGLSLCGCRYTRGSFIFPEAQPYPYTSFEDEVIYIQETLPSNLIYKKATVMPSKLPSISWHVFTASDPSRPENQPQPSYYTVEVCMTQLDTVLARKFFRHPTSDKTGDMSGKDMTVITGINEINPKAFISDFGFDPCGYSMNGMDGDRYSTIHVTPEDGYSYASFECTGSVHEDGKDIGRVLKKVAKIFRPETLSVSVTGGSQGMSARVARALKTVGLKCRSYADDEFPFVGQIGFQVFTNRLK